jgi:transposase
MTKPLSLDLRHRIVEEEGMSRRAAAARFGVAPSTVIELVRHCLGGASFTFFHSQRRAAVQSR